MFLSSAFRVLHLSSHELQVVAPPHYLLVIIFALPAILGLWIIWRALVIKNLLFLAIGLVWCGGLGVGRWGGFRGGWGVLGYPRHYRSLFIVARLFLPLD